MTTKGYPIICAIIESLGMSSSWEGNAILAAKPSNFYSLWQQNQHFVLYPERRDLVYENEEIDFVRLMTGASIQSNKKYIDHQIENNDLSKNKGLLKILDNNKEGNSALHIVGNISENGVYGDVRHLLSYLRLAKQRNVYRVYLHLIFDDNVTTEIIENFTTELKNIGVGEIASVCGQNFIKDENSLKKNFYQSLSAIVFGRGQKALSHEQALSLAGLKSPSDKLPTSVLFQRNYSCRINDFDTVLFSNHNNKLLSRLILALSRETKSFWQESLPKLLTIITPINPFDQPLDQVHEIFKRRFSNSIFSVCEKDGKNQLLISDSSRLSFINKFSPPAQKNIIIPVLKQSSFAHYGQVYQIILRQVENAIHNQTADIIYILVPVLSSAARAGNFASAVDTIKVLDEFLGRLEKTVFEGDKGTLAIISDHGGVDKMSHKTHFEEKNNKSLNPVPFIIKTSKNSTDKKIAHGIAFSHLMYDIIKNKHLIKDFAPSFLSLAGIPQPDFMEGKNLIE